MSLLSFITKPALNLISKPKIEEKGSKIAAKTLAKEWQLPYPK